VRFVQGRLTIQGDRILHIEPLDGPASPGALTITPGFIDAHAHPLGLGLGLTRVDLAGAGSYAEALRKIAAVPAAEGWLQGRGWDQTRWSDPPPGGWPLAKDLDTLAGERPVFLRRVDGHAAWVNGAALRAAGIDGKTPDPPGGRILRGPDGAPSGVLVDTAMDWPVGTEVMLKVRAVPDELPARVARHLGGRIVVVFRQDDATQQALRRIVPNAEAMAA
jgi:predicted amidohydrolase YtcJ